MNDAAQVYLGPVIAIIVRHSANCPYKGDESFKRCNCWKTLRWFDGKKQRYEATKSRTWAGAERAKREKEIVLDPHHAPSTAERNVTIKDSVDSYLKSKEGRTLKKSTTRKIRYQLGCFEQFCTMRSKFHAWQLTKEDLIEYRATWDSWKSGVTRQKAQTTLRAFLKYICSDFQHHKILSDALQSIKLSREDKERLEPRPYTEEEIDKLLRQIPIEFEGDSTRIAQMIALIHCQVATGVAIADAIALERANISDGWLRIRRLKTDKSVRQRLDPGLHQELLSVAHDRYIFHDGTGVIDSVTALYSAHLRKIMEKVGLYIKGNLSHRFRDTAVDFWLAQGWALSDVAEGLGDTIAVVERHYKSLESKRSEQRLSRLPVRSWDAPKQEH